MSDKGKKRLIYSVVGFCLVMQIAAKNNSDAFLEVINGIEDNVLKEKLWQFSQGTIERQPTLDDYDREGIIAYAESLIGTPHRMGGTSLSGLDCSGMVMLVHAKFNVSLPHGSQEQARFGKIISSTEELKRGDLVFFHSTYRTSKLVTHSGIYLGDDKFIHTSSSRGVTVSEIQNSSYWKAHYLFATRLSE